MRIAFREWRVCWDHKTKEPVLYSTFKKYAWESGSETSDQLPELHDEGHSFGSLHGLHAVLDWDKSRFLTKPTVEGPKVFVQGAVDIHGRVRDHEDGVVRAEHMRILALRVIEVPHSIKPCTHQDQVYAVNRSLDGDRLVIQHCTCFVGKIDPYSGEPPGPYDPHPTPLIAYANFTVVELEYLLTSKYEVPKLPLGIGPWKSPWGSGPVEENDGLGNRSKESS